MKKRTSLKYKQKYLCEDQLNRFHSEHLYSLTLFPEVMTALVPIFNIHFTCNN